MAIVAEEYVERVLIVLNADQTLKGAQQERLRTIRDGDTVLQHLQLPPEPIGAQTLANVLPASAALLSQVEALLLTVERLTEDLAGRDERIAKLLGQIAAMAEAQPGT